MKKKILIITLVILFIIIGCLFFVLNKNSNKELDMNSFIKITEKNGFKIQDVKEQFSEEIVKEAKVAYNNNYQIEFLVFNDVNSAKNSFGFNKQSFELDEAEVIDNEDISKDKYSIYYKLTKNKYMYVKRVDNKLLYFNVDGSYKEDLESILKKLNF